MRFLVIMVPLTFLIPKAALAESEAYCSFETLPPMTLVTRGGMGAYDNTFQIRGRDPVPSSVGSGFVGATLDGINYLIGSQGIDVLKTDGSDARFFRSGGCSPSADIFSTNLVTDLEKALAFGFYWNETNICKAALETYFFLSDPPELIDSSGYLHFLKSQSGIEFVCSINHLTVEFRWWNQQGEQMTSNSTTYLFSGTGLEIESDMQTMTYELP